MKKIKTKTEYMAHHEKSIFRRIFWALIDLFDNLFGRSKSGLIPPRSITHFSAKQWKDYGENFQRHFVEIGGLSPKDKVLDVGSGIGSAAVGLTNYLSKDGEYHGFDIDKMQVDWCKSNITKNYSNFHFQHADVKNFNYNPNGTIQSKSYKFPYEDEYFDFVYLLSVFTHMYTPDMENYLKEISRVLKPGGRSFVTYFLLNEESENFISQGKSSQNLIYDINGCITSNLENPEEANGFREEHITRLYRDNNLAITKPINYGSWCGRDIFFDYQDVVIGTKE